MLWPSSIEAQSPIPGAKPVTGARLQGTTLILNEWNCSVTAPGADWTWLQLDAPSTRNLPSGSFVCWQAGTDTRLIFSVAEGNTAKVSDSFADQFLTGVRRSMQKREGTLTDVRRTSSDIPIRGSYQISGTFNQPGREATRWRCYLAAAGPTYVFQSYSLEESEPVAFRQLVSSFRLLRQPAPKPSLETTKSVAACAQLLGGVVVVLLCYGIGYLVNRSFGRPVVNGAAVGLVLLLVGCVALMVYVASLPGFSKLDAEKQGEAIGTIFGEFLIPLILAAFLAWRFQKKKKNAPRAQANGAPS